MNEPTINRGAINEDTSFGQHITEVCIAHCGSAIPTDTPQDKFGGEMSPFEFRLDYNVLLSDESLLKSGGS